MSTIRYTLGGDYDPTNSRKLNTKSVGSPLDGIEPHYDKNFYLDGLFVIYGPLGKHVVRQLDTASDGIYVDLSDSSGVLIGGGDAGDVLIGSPEADTIYGGDGNDRITGGLGGDLIYSGIHDADTIVYLSAEDSPTRNRDRILNFSGARFDGDQIDLTAIAAFTFIGSNEFSANGVAEIRYNRPRFNYIILGDADGDGRADFKIQIRSTGGEITAADFVGVTAAPHAEPHSFAHPAFAEPFYSLAHLPLA